MTGFKYYADKVLGEIKSSFANNMFILLFLILVFIIPLIAAYYYPDSFASVLQPMIQQFEQNIADGTVTLATDSLFVNNFTVALILYAGGALLGIMGITVLAMNGLFLGFFAAQMDLTSYIAFILCFLVVTFLIYYGRSAAFANGFSAAFNRLFPSPV